MGSEVQEREETGGEADEDPRALGVARSGMGVRAAVWAWRGLGWECELLL